MGPLGVLSSIFGTLPKLSEGPEEALGGPPRSHGGLQGRAGGREQEIGTAHQWVSRAGASNSVTRAPKHFFGNNGLETGDEEIFLGREALLRVGGRLPPLDQREKGSDLRALSERGLGG